MALALAPFMANSENTIKLIIKDEITFVKQDETDDKKTKNVHPLFNHKYPYS